MTKVVFNRGRANRSKREVQTVNYNRLPIDPSKLRR